MDPSMAITGEEIAEKFHKVRLVIKTPNERKKSNETKK